VPRRRRGRWGRIFWGSVAGLVSLAVGLSLDSLIRDLYARNDWLGTVGLALAALAILAALVILIREGTALARLARIDRLREAAAHAAAEDDGEKASAVVKDLVALYRDRPETARGRAALARHVGEVIDGKDLLMLAEEDLLAGFDARARKLVSDAAKRVSIVTAVSPRALVDVGFVAVVMISLIRRLAELYGGRPGTIGFLSLMRHVLGHLAVTSGMAIGDSLLHQVLGYGVAARISARLGEGVINGILTARVGIAAIDVCRPLPFLGAERPKISEVMAGVAGFADGSEPKPSASAR
jgi:putative membrane protein